jgi:hypothetical protein
VASSSITTKEILGSVEATDLQELPSIKTWEIGQSSYRGVLGLFHTDTRQSLDLVMGTNRKEPNLQKYLHFERKSTNPLHITHNTGPNKSQSERHITQGSADTTQLSDHHPAINEYESSLRQTTQSVRNIRSTST